jgi:phosphatidylserine synthase
MERGFLDFFALGVLVMIGITVLYAVIYIHDIPYEIAKKRNHPHQDAIHTAGWVSLFLMHTIWPFLWIWATLYKPEVGWGMETVQMENTSEGSSPQNDEIAELQKRVTALEAQIGKITEEA